MKKGVCAIRILVYVAAVVAGWAGLGVGLQHDPTLGTVLIAAGLSLATLNTIWIVRSGKKPPAEPEPEQDAGRQEEEKA